MPFLEMAHDMESDPDVQMDMTAEATGIESLSVLVKNRRKRYLDMHPEYFSADLELAGPLALILCR